VGDGATVGEEDDGLTSRYMSKEAPEWRLMIPQSCEKFGKAYSEEAFESAARDSDIEILDRQYRTWCKQCDSQYMDETEQT
jgi:hypothetical protein